MFFGCCSLRTRFKQMRKARRKSRCGVNRPWVARLRASLIAAVTEEVAQASKDSMQDGERHLFERLPNPPNLEYGQVQYLDGKLKYFD